MSISYDPMSKPAPFAMGDVVSLKSGIMLMTVECCRQYNGGWLIDIWFDHNRLVHRGAFDAVSLQQWKAVDHE